MKVFKEIMSWIIPIAVGLLLAALLGKFVIARVRVDGPSMQPNLDNNEKVWILKQSKIKHLSVVVFDAHGVDPSAKAKTKYVKRVIGLPGDTVSFNNGQLYVNKKKVNQNFISASERTSGTTDGSGHNSWNLQTLSKRFKWGNGSKVVPKGEYFVLGDHRSVSNDGRYWGFVPKSKIDGVVKVPVWSSTATKRHNVNSLSY
ncbi:signal peptidase I [Secundilactobacillus oryzae]|nr:signal peptidase I [Secundilactobacillus oryzae]